MVSLAGRGTEHIYFQSEISSRSRAVHREGRREAGGRSGLEEEEGRETVCMILCPVRLDLNISRTTDIKSGM